MILIEATIKYKGYDPRDLKPNSHKKVCCSCDICGRVSYKPISDYCNLCKSCGMKGKLIGKNHPNYKVKINLICQECGKKFKVIPSKNKSKFCSIKCYHKYRIGKFSGENHPMYGIHKFGKDSPNWRGGKKIIKHCKQCGKEFKVVLSGKNRKFCSKKCSGKWKSENLSGENSSNYKHVQKICEQCGKMYEVKQSKKDKTKFCSIKCKCEYRSENFSGEFSPNWQGGVSKLDQPHLTPINQCIKLNNKIKGFDGHHIMKSVIIYLPRNLHSINWHDLKNNKNMKEINEIAMNYLIGDINE